MNNKAVPPERPAGSFLKDQRRWAAEQRRLYIMRQRLAMFWVIGHPPQNLPNVFSPAQLLEILKTNHPELFVEAPPSTKTFKGH